jgi:hypothetical protein
VEFNSSADAERALEHTNNKIVNGAKLRVEYAKSDKTSRRPLSRDHSPTSILYSHLQVTANRLPPMQVFRQNYHQYYPPTMISNSTSLSRGRSLTPPSFKQNSRLPSMHHLRTQDFYYQQPAIYSDPAYYRTYGGDPYLMQRLPPPAFLPSTSPPLSRAYRNMYSSSGIDRYMTTVSYHRRSRSRSRRRTSPARRNRLSRDRKRKRRTSSSSAQRGPRTPPPSSKSSTNRSKKRSRSGSDTVASTSERKSSSNSSLEDVEKRSSSRRSPDDDNDSNRKHAKRKTRE